MNLRLFILFFFISAFNISLKAQTVTDPWATLGASNIATSFIAMDASNNLYVTNYGNATISKITPNGTVTQAWATLAGNSHPYGIVMDASGNLYTANRNPTNTVSKITPTLDGSSGTVIQTWASISSEAYTIAIDASGNLYIPYVNQNRIDKIVPSPSGTSGVVTANWKTLATGANPFSIAFDASGNLYSANSNNTISKITSGGIITNAWATLAVSSNPQFMVFDAAGNMYVSCWGTSTVSKITPGAVVTETWATVGTSVRPAGIVCDAAGNIFTANFNNNTISKITSNGTVTQSYVSLASGSAPFFLAKDAAGNLYVTNMGNGTVSKISSPNIYITSSGQKISIENVNSIISPEGGANFGTGRDAFGKLYNTTGLTTTSGTIGSTTAILGGVISATNAVTSSVGVVYSTASNFGTYSTTTIQSNAAAGTYTSSITGLTASTTYYAKSFIVNSAGTSYGDVFSFITAAPAPAIVTSGLILHLDASDPASYNGSGTTWTDKQGIASGTINGAINYVSNGNASYFSLPGADNAYIRSSVNQSIKDFTIVFEPDFSSFNYSGGHTLFSKGPGVDISMRFWSYNFGDPINTDGNPASVWGVPNSSPNGGEWQGTTSMYLNGINQTLTFFPLVSGWNILGGQNSSSYGWGSFAYCLGAGYNTRAFQGKIAVVLFYDRVLTASEQLQNHNALKTRFGL